MSGIDLPFVKQMNPKCLAHDSEGTLSAGEMVAAFAAENGLARIVGTRTGGQVLGGGNFSVGHGFVLRFPAAGWYTWRGAIVEGRGVEPDVDVALSAEGLRHGKDNQLEAALRRRFAFIELMPDVEVLRGAKVGTLALDDFLEELNRRIAKTEGREKQIGHSFLLDGAEPITDTDEFARRFRQEILPLLQEYCYDDYTALASYIGPKLVDKNAQTLDRERLADADALVAALEEEFGRREGGVV
jgi:Peptidase family S41